MTYSTGHETGTERQNQSALGTIRLISAALKDRDIAARGQDKADGITDDDIWPCCILIKQRHDLVAMYKKAGYLVVRESRIRYPPILPEPLSEAECDLG